MQSRPGPLKALTASKYARAFLFYSLPMMCAVALVPILRGQTLTADAYLVLNLAVTAVLSFFAGLASDRLFTGAGSAGTAFTVKAAVAAAALVLANQAVSLALAGQAATEAAGTGGWLAFSVAVNERPASVPPWLFLLAVLFWAAYSVLLHRRNAGTRHGRHTTIFLGLMAAAYLSAFLSAVLHGGALTLLEVRNFGGLSLTHLYAGLAFCLGLHWIFTGKWILPRNPDGSVKPRHSLQPGA